MVLASVDPRWLHVIGQIAGTLLLVELGLVLFVMLAFAGVLAFAAWWLRRHVIPVVTHYSDRAREAMQVTTHGTDRVVRGVAEFHGRKQGIERTLRVLLFGPGAAGETLVVPLGSAQRGVGAVPGLSTVEGFAPQDLPADSDRSTRDITAADLASSRAAPNGHVPPAGATPGAAPSDEIPS